MRLSRNEQDYLKGIYLLSEEEEFVSVKKIAGYLNISVPSANEMIKRLEKKFLVNHYAYKGIKLTEDGKYEALFILKAHRVWEYFLVNKLGYQLDDVHDDAELLEHNASAKLVERLYKYLREPAVCPHGSEIPNIIFWEEESKVYKMSDVKCGMVGELILTDETAEKYIEEFGIKNFKWVEILKRMKTDNTIIIRVENNWNNLVLSEKIQEHFRLRTLDA